MKRLKISIEGMSPKPDEIVIAKCTNDNETMFEAKELYDMLVKAFENNKVFICPSDYQLLRLGKSQLKIFIKSLQNIAEEKERNENSNQTYHNDDMRPF